MAKQYLIVGGSTGIGKAITEQLLAKGAKVIVVSRSATQRMSATDMLEVHDRDATSADADWSFLPEKLDGIAYLGGSINLKPFHRLKNEDFIEDFRINLLGAINTIQATLSAMKNAGKASIVLFSTVAVQRGLTFHASVAAAKGAVEGLTRSLSAELAPNIRVNAIALSLTETPMAEKLLSNDVKKQAADQRHALKRHGVPADIAAPAAFLLSDASSWMTGQIIGVDGGMGTVQNL